MYMGHLGHPNQWRKNDINQVRVQPKNRLWLPDYRWEVANDNDKLCIFGVCFIQQDNNSDQLAL